jgi:hypothetical protein
MSTAAYEYPAEVAQRHAAVIRAARRVVLNAYGTKPRHTRARDGGCRDDCIPCGLAELDAAITALDSTANIPKRQEDQ